MTAHKLGQDWASRVTKSEYPDVSIIGASPEHTQMIVNIYRTSIETGSRGHLLEVLYAVTDKLTVYEQPPTDCRPGLAGIPREGWRIRIGELPPEAKHVGQFYISTKGDREMSLSDNDKALIENVSKIQISGSSTFRELEEFVSRLVDMALQCESADGFQGAMRIHLSVLRNALMSAHLRQQEG